MIIHSFCSYTYSSVGYQYGTYNASVQLSDGTLSEEHKLNIVSAAFDSGMIRELYGKYNDGFVYLVKKLKFIRPDDIEVGKELFINIAFSFTYKEKEAFTVFKKKFSALSNEEKAERIATLLIIDTASEYGIKIDAHAAYEFNTEMTKPDFSESITKEDADILSIICIATDQDYSEKIASILQLQPEYVSRSDTDSRCYRYPGKRGATVEESPEKQGKKNSAIVPTMNTGLSPFFSCIIAASLIIIVLFMTKVNGRNRHAEKQ